MEATWPHLEVQREGLLHGDAGHGIHVHDHLEVVHGEHVCVCGGDMVPFMCFCC